MAIDDFVVGQVYNRRRDIHARFGGQMQGGICTPARFSIVIAFTGASGARHGYADEWIDGTFRYFGEGQKGDMTLTGGNKAIAEHAAAGKDLLLFETLGKGQIGFRGVFNCAGYSFEPGKDRLGAIRQAIVFQLIPLERGALQPGPVPQKNLTPHNLADLRRKAFAAAGPARQVEKKEASRSYYVRSEAVRQYVLARANGICESCEHSAPFETIGGTPYLEPHHIRRLTDGGPDNPAFMGAICPNCHREIHHGRDGRQINKNLQAKITAKEPAG